MNGVTDDGKKALHLIALCRNATDKLLHSLAPESTQDGVTYNAGWPAGGLFHSDIIKNSPEMALQYPYKKVKRNYP